MVLKLATGSKKGITLATTKSARELRPTQALVREAIVNIARGYLDLAGIRALDLYAGIGTVGLELLSNGASHVTFVERDPRCLKILGQNLSTLNYSSQATVIAKPLPQALSRLLHSSQAGGYDLIFADPPYEQDAAEKIIKEILANALLAGSGILVWEQASKPPLKLAPEAGFAGLKLIKQKSYGETSLYFFCKPDAD